MVQLSKTVHDNAVLYVEWQEQEGNASVVARVALVRQRGFGPLGCGRWCESLVESSIQDIPDSYMYIELKITCCPSKISGLSESDNTRYNHPH